jgi:hypothetical protein
MAGRGSKLERNGEGLSSGDEAQAASADGRICAGLSEPPKGRIHPRLQLPIGPQRPTPRQIKVNERFGPVKVSVRAVGEKSEARPSRFQTKILCVPHSRAGQPKYG